MYIKNHRFHVKSSSITGVIYKKKHYSNIINIINLLADCKSIEDFNNILSISIENLLQNIKLKNEQNISDHIERAIDYINQNIQKDLSLDDISKHISLSIAYTCRLFKKETGQNLTAYITLTKLNEAKKLFDNTDLKIYEVAQAVGISNTNYFSSLFKKHIGISPSEYIQQKQLLSRK